MVTSHYITIHIHIKENKSKEDTVNIEETKLTNSNQQKSQVGEDYKFTLGGKVPKS